MPKPTPFGIRLSEARKKQGLSQNQLSEISGIASSQISFWEAGINQYPNVANLTKLAKALNVSTDYLLGIELGDRIPEGFELEMETIDEFLSQLKVDILNYVETELLRLRRYLNAKTGQEEKPEVSQASC